MKYLFVFLSILLPSLSFSQQSPKAQHFKFVNAGDVFWKRSFIAHSQDSIFWTFERRKVKEFSLVKRNMNLEELDLMKFEFGAQNFEVNAGFIGLVACENPIYPDLRTQKETGDIVALAARRTEEEGFVCAATVFEPTGKVVMSKLLDVGNKFTDKIYSFSPDNQYWAIIDFAVDKELKVRVFDSRFKLKWEESVEDFNWKNYVSFNVNNKGEVVLIHEDKEMRLYFDIINENGERVRKKTNIIPERAYKYDKVKSHFKKDGKLAVAVMCRKRGISDHLILMDLDIYKHEIAYSKKLYLLKDDLKEYYKDAVRPDKHKIPKQLQYGVISRLFEDAKGNLVVILECKSYDSEAYELLDPKKYSYYDILTFSFNDQLEPAWHHIQARDMIYTGKLPNMNLKPAPTKTIYTYDDEYLYILTNDNKKSFVTTRHVNLYVQKVNLITGKAEDKKHIYNVNSSNPFINYIAWDKANKRLVYASYDDVVSFSADDVRLVIIDVDE